MKHWKSSQSILSAPLLINQKTLFEVAFYLDLERECAKLRVSRALRAFMPLLFTYLHFFTFLTCLHFFTCLTYLLFFPASYMLLFFTCLHFFYVPYVPSFLMCLMGLHFFIKSGTTHNQQQQSGMSKSDVE